MEGWADRRVSIVEGGEGALPPPPRNGKKMLSEKFLTSFTCFTNEIRGDRQALHTCKMEGGGRIGAWPWWEGVGAKRPCPPPRKWKKKRLSEEILTAFTYVLLIKLVGIDIHCIHAKWKGVGRQALVHGGRGWGPCPPPP